MSDDARRSRRPRPAVPWKPVKEQIHRLGLTPAMVYAATGLAPSTVHASEKSGTVPVAYALAVEALVRRQSREATQWALLRLAHGTADVTYIAEPQAITIGGKAMWLIEKPDGAA